jgi:hypothetical protein
MFVFCSCNVNITYTFLSTIDIKNLVLWSFTPCRMVNIHLFFWRRTWDCQLGCAQHQSAGMFVLRWADRGSISTRVKDQAIRRTASLETLGRLKSIRCCRGRKSLFSGGHGNLSFNTWEGGGWSISLWPFSLPANSMFVHSLPYSHKVPNSVKSASKTQWIRRGCNITWQGIPGRFILPSPFVLLHF